MRKISIMLVALFVAVSFAACGRKDNTNTTDKNDMTILPTDMPTIETNIPDPDINTEMPMYTEGTGITDTTVDMNQEHTADRK